MSVLYAEDASCQRTLPSSSTSVVEAPDVQREAPDIAGLRGHWRAEASEDRYKMAGTMILLFQAVPLPNFETSLQSERRNRLLYRKRSQRKEKLTLVMKTPKARAAENTQMTTPELLRRISGSLETQEVTTTPPRRARRGRRQGGPDARRSLRFPSEDEVDQGGLGEGEFVWGGVGQELCLIADRMVAARVVEYQGRTNYYTPSEASSDSPNIIYSFLVVAIFKYICNLFTKFI